MRNRHLTAALTVALLLVPHTSNAQAHHHHDNEPLSAETLGHVHFPVSCIDSQQAPFERGIALLHSFGYTEAEMQFRAIAAADPHCAMAHWGIAMSQFQELWSRPDASAVKTGNDEIARARGIVASPGQATPRERAYIDALGTFYKLAITNYQPAADAYSAAMKSLSHKYPADVEAAAFYALSILASEAPGDTSLVHERASLAILVPLFRQNPHHPGLAHYIIHTCDSPKLAQQGLEAATVYAKIAPSSPHALHMPGHIFARLGMWQPDIDSNLASVAASEKAEKAGTPGAAHQMHADEFLIYAYLQVGEDEKARTLATRIRSIGAHMMAMPGMDDMKDSGPFFDNELRAIVPMETHDWKALASIQHAPGAGELYNFPTYWGQGVAAGHLRDAKLAHSALAAFDKSADEVRRSPLFFLFNGLLIKHDKLVGWQEFALNHPDAAIAAMRKAADQQDKLGQDEVDIPAREMLGDLLMLLHRPQDALAEYKVALTLSPNRLNGLLSAGAAAEALGNKPEAAKYYAAASHNTHNSATSKRPELLHAVQSSK